MSEEVFQPEGNYYDKYGSNNPIVKLLMNGFFSSLARMLNASEIAVRGGYCLEAGCGEGNVTKHMSEWISEHNNEVEYMAFDISEKLIKDNSVRYKDIKFFTHNIYEELDKNNLSDVDTFDLIVCSEVLEHLEKPDVAVKNLMNYGDRFIFSVPNEPIWRIMNMARGKYIKSFGNTPGHIQHFSKNRFIRMIRDCGLRVVKIEKPLPWLMIYCEK